VAAVISKPLASHRPGSPRRSQDGELRYERNENQPLPMAQSGDVNEPLPPAAEDVEPDPDDDLLPVTPPDVVAMLGFDPLTDSGFMSTQLQPVPVAEEHSEARHTQPMMTIVDGIITYDGEAEALGVPSRVGEWPGYREFE
jgi:hypothetical protein